MKKTITITIYVILILILVYLVLIQGFIVLWLTYVGGDMLYYHQDLPLTEEYSGNATIPPAILLFIYIVLSGIYFILLGYYKVKEIISKG